VVATLQGPPTPGGSSAEAVRTCETSGADMRAHPISQLHHINQQHHINQIDRRPPPRATASLLAVVAVCAAIVTACGTTHNAAPVPSTEAPAATAGSSTSVSLATTAPTTSAPKSTTTPSAATTLAPVIPVAPQPSAQAAAAALVSGWSAGNKVFALSVATAASVATLFAVPYQAGNAVFRGCSAAFSPIVCTYGPPGGGNGALYEVNVSPTGAKWYVSSVVVED
jgi:hypothetical protein